jgi:hypothetical protein
LVDPTVRINVPDIIHSKWDEMLTPYHNIFGKLNERLSKPFEQSYKTRYGNVVNIRDFASRIDSVRYKLTYAVKSLEYLLGVYGKYSVSFEASERAMTDSISEDFIFQEDVFFYFAYSALDIVGGIIDTLVETGLDKHEVSFTKVFDFLASTTKSPFVGSLIDELKKDSDKGWICELRQYRNFVTHHSAIHPKLRFSASNRNKTIEINLFMLPDDPNETSFAYEKKRELVPYCQEVLTRELDVMKVLLEFVEKLM